MSNIIDLDTAGNITAEAIQWVVKLDGQRLPSREFADFQAWLGLSTAHEDAFRKAANTWGNLDILAEAPTLNKTTPQRLSKNSTWWGKIQRPQFAGACALILMCVVAIGYISSPPVSPLPVTHSTPIGVNRTIDLADGSKILLNTNSQVEVQYEADRRVLKLLKGEAHFEVASDPTRPFEVFAGTNIVRAIGTAFTVELKSELVEVTVTEGTVQLASFAAPHAANDSLAETPLALISSGQAAEFSGTIQSVTSMAPDEIEARLAWHTGALVFKGEPLDQVIQEIRRYTDTRIIITDPDIRSLKIGGYFKTTETDNMLQALETSFNITVTRVNQDLVYLSGTTSK